MGVPNPRIARFTRRPFTVRDLSRRIGLRASLSVATNGGAAARPHMPGLAESRSTPDRPLPVPLDRGAGSGALGHGCADPVRGWCPVGTSSRWPGPGGRSGTTPGEWSRVSRRLSSWRSDLPGAPAKLDEIFEDYLQVLHRTLREDPSAFGLYDAACAAGERLTSVMDAMSFSHEGSSPGHEGSSAVPGESDGTDFVARFTAAVGGEGGTVADAAVRRAAAATADRIRRLHSEALAPGGTGWSGDLLCLLYQWFFTDVVAEFLRVVIAEKVKLIVPGLPLADPEDRVADWVAQRVLRLLPNPCEEAARLGEAAEQAEDMVTALEDPTVGTLAQVARGLVPRAVGAALGLLTDAGSGPDTPVSSEETPAA